MRMLCSSSFQRRALQFQLVIPNFAPLAQGGPLPLEGSWKRSQRSAKSKRPKKGSARSSLLAQPLSFARSAIERVEDHMLSKMAAKVERSGLLRDLWELGKEAARESALDQEPYAGVLNDFFRKWWDV